MDYPRPYKPHFKFIGGFSIKEAMQLHHALETFVEGSGGFWPLIKNKRKECFSLRACS